MSTTPDWDQRYRSGDAPWDSGLPSRELKRVLEEQGLKPCRALELGCGSGTNAVFLAQQGFSVTAVDVSNVALERARQRAAEAGVEVEFLQGDVCHLDQDFEPFDFLFDRGCYHCARRLDLSGYLETLQCVSRRGTKYLSLVGNANEQTDEGPPRLREDEIRADLGDLFEIEQLREFRFEDPGGADGPLGWSCWMTRR